MVCGASLTWVARYSPRNAIRWKKGVGRYIGTRCSLKSDDTFEHTAHRKHNENASGGLYLQGPWIHTKGLEYTHPWAGPWIHTHIQGEQQPRAAPSSPEHHRRAAQLLVAQSSAGPHKTSQSNPEQRRRQRRQIWTISFSYSPGPPLNCNGIFSIVCKQEWMKWNCV